MLKISHRGNTNGPNPEKENSPEYILDAIDKGFDVEIDIWVIDDSVWFGHDAPQYGPISEKFIEQILDVAWLHCKNLDAINWLKQYYPNAKYFWHQNDDYTLTSNGFIWTYPGKAATKNCIVVSLDENEELSYGIYGVCSDWVGKKWK